MKKYRVTLDPAMRTMKHLCGGREFVTRRDGSAFIAVPIYLAENEMNTAIAHDDWLVVEELSLDQQRELEERKKCLLQHPW